MAIMFSSSVYNYLIQFCIYLLAGSAYCPVSKTGMYRETSGKQNQDRYKAITRRGNKAKNYVWFNLKVTVRVEGKNITHKSE